MHSARSSTLFPADIAVFTGSAAPPLTLVQEACGCFNDASACRPLGLAGAAGLRSHRKWRYVSESPLNALSELPNRFLQIPPPRLAFLVCVRIASHRRDTSWWLRRATRAELEGVPGGEMIAVARSMEVSAGAKATSAPVAHAHNFLVAPRESMSAATPSEIDCKPKQLP